MDRGTWEEIQRLASEKKAKDAAKAMRMHRLWPAGSIGDMATQTADAIDRASSNPVHAIVMINALYSRVLSHMFSDPKNLQKAVGGMLSASIDVVCDETGQNKEAAYNTMYAFIKNAAINAMETPSQQNIEAIWKTPHPSPLQNTLAPAANIVWCYERARLAYNLV